MDGKNGKEIVFRYLDDFIFFQVFQNRAYCIKIVVIFLVESLYLFY